MPHLTGGDVLLEHNTAISSLSAAQLRAIERCGDVRNFGRRGLFRGMTLHERLLEVCRAEAHQRNRGWAA